MISDRDAAYNGAAEEEEIFHALQRGEEAAVRALLRKRKQPLSQAASGPLLEQALGNSPQIFAEVLDRCSPVEHYISAERFTAGQPHTLQFKGTILLEAAALNRCAHMQILLERGWDCNSASLSAQSPCCKNGIDLGAYVSNWNNICFFSSPSGHVPQGAPFILHDGPTYYEGTPIIGCTPLSAAILCGSLEAVQLLAAQPGIWREESPSVCRAVLLAGEGAPQDCVRALFPAAYAAIPQGGTITKTLLLHPEAVADLCTPQQLQDQLDLGSYTPEQLRQLLKGLDVPEHFLGGTVAHQGKKLLLVAAYAPELCREPWATGLFLRAVLTAADQNKPYRRLLHCWERLCGPVGDLSWAWNCMSIIPLSKLRQLLTQLGAKTHLVLDADCVCTEDGWSNTSLVELLIQYVEILPSQWEGGVSGFSVIVLQSNSLRLAKRVARLGWPGGESKVDLLRYLKEWGRTSTLLPLLLTGQLQAGRSIADGQGRTPVRAYFQGGITYGADHWSYDPQPVAERWTSRQQWWEETYLGDLSPEERLRRIVSDSPSCFGQYPDLSVPHPRWGPLKATERTIALCCAENPAALETLLLIAPSLVHHNLLGAISDTCGLFHMTLRASPMCWAAAAGRIAQIRVLLDHGAAVNEEDHGRCSFFCRGDNWCDLVILTPLLAALMQEEEPAARLLLDAGARCNLRDAAVQRAVRLLFSQGARELTAQLLNVELSQLPAPAEQTDGCEEQTPDLTNLWQSTAWGMRASPPILWNNGAAQDCSAGEDDLPF